VAEVARGRIPFQNWVEPSIRRQGQLQPQVNRMPREGIHCFINIARCTILSKAVRHKPAHSSFRCHPREPQVSRNDLRSLVVAHGDEKRKSHPNRESDSSCVRGQSQLRHLFFVDCASRRRRKYESSPAGNDDHQDGRSTN
jgi:hypothetical protein